MKSTEIILFRLYKMPCCGHLLCWVNPRIPSHCPECGQSVYMKLKFDEADHIVIRDEKAQLTYNH